MVSYGNLCGHKGCVNTIHFNPAGDLLVSGSDDKGIILWNWESKYKKFTYASGHMDNVFQALIMPFTEDRTIITSAADGQVCQLLGALLMQNLSAHLQCLFCSLF